MVLFHKEFRVSSTITGKSMFRNKIPETLKPGCLCNGMKTLISDHDYELHLGGTAKPRRLAVGSVPDPGGPVRLDQWGAFNLDGRGPGPCSRGDWKEIRKRFWTQSHDRGVREDYGQFPNCCANGQGARHCHLGARQGRRMARRRIDPPGPDL